MPTYLIVNRGQNRDMKIGYCRVSTEGQNPDLQLTALKQAECKKIFTDKATGAHVKRPPLTRCLASLHTGDVRTGEYQGPSFKHEAHLDTVSSEFRR